MRITISGATGEQFAKRAVYLLWKACRGPSGMGILQDRGDGISEDSVWDHAYGCKDYVGGRGGLKSQEVYCDYVFGRMMKWGCKWDADKFETPDRDFRSDYQGFSEKYPDNERIIEAVADSLNVTYSILGGKEL